MEKKKYDMSLALWEKDSGNALTHIKGLTQEQVDQLRELRVGDRLILFRNEKKGDTSPHFSLKKFNPPPREDDGGL